MHIERQINISKDFILFGLSCFDKVVLAPPAGHQLEKFLYLNMHSLIYCFFAHFWWHIRIFTTLSPQRYLPCLPANVLAAIASPRLSLQTGDQTMLTYKKNGREWKEGRGRENQSVFFFFLCAISRNDSTINSCSPNMQCCTPRCAATVRDDTQKHCLSPWNASELWRRFYPPNTKNQTYRDGWAGSHCGWLVSLCVLTNNRHVFKNLLTNRWKGTTRAKVAEWICHDSVCAAEWERCFTGFDLVVSVRQ